MDRLWAPWRIAYIKGIDTNPDGCFLCAALAGDRARDHETYLLHRGADALVILNAYPYNSGHLMVAPNRHVAALEALTPAERLALLDLSAVAMRALERALRPQGYNLGMNLGRAAGAGLESHLHLHIVPRWGGDTNFMPVLGATKVLPESLDDTYRNLKAVFDEALRGA